MWESRVVVAEQEKLKLIDERLSISSISGVRELMETGLPSWVGTTFPLKGNKDLILKLQKAGWICRYRVRKGNGYFQKMEKQLKYQKYAIYKTSVGLRAIEYYDNIHDIKRNGLSYIQEDSLPVVVNRMGGYHSFEEEYEQKDGFLEIAIVPEDEEPLTREQMYPKNSEYFKYGWIDRAGNTYTCGFEGHAYAAEAICKELGLDYYRAERELEKQGYVKISRPAPYTPENMDETYPYFNMSGSGVGEYISKRQYEKLCELGFEDNWEVKFWSRMEIVS